MADFLYLDHNCFQRGFDDQSQFRIRMEAIACEAVFANAEAGNVRLAWSFMHEDEAALCPFPDRQLEALSLSRLCEVRIGPKEEIRTKAKQYQREASLSSKGALHLACAVDAGAKVLLTCDDRFLRRARRLKLEIEILNPVEYVRQMEGDAES